MVDRRALAVEVRALGIGADQSVEVARLEFVSSPTKRSRSLMPKWLAPALKTSRKVSAQSVV